MHLLAASVESTLKVRSSIRQWSQYDIRVQLIEVLQPPCVQKWNRTRIQTIDETVAKEIAWWRFEQEPTKTLSELEEEVRRMMREAKKEMGDEKGEDVRVEGK